MRTPPQLEGAARDVFSGPRACAAGGRRALVWLEFWGPRGIRRELHPGCNRGKMISRCLWTRMHRKRAGTARRGPWRKGPFGGGHQTSLDGRDEATQDETGQGADVQAAVSGLEQGGQSLPPAGEQAAVKVISCGSVVGEVVTFISLNLALNPGPCAFPSQRASFIILHWL